MHVELHGQTSTQVIINSQSRFIALGFFIPVDAQFLPEDSSGEGIIHSKRLWQLDRFIQDGYAPFPFKFQIIVDAEGGGNSQVSAFYAALQSVADA